MGVKLTSIIIKNPGSIPDLEILNSLWKTDFKDLPVTTFDECMHPWKEDTIYFGNYKDNLIISTYAYDLVDKFFTDKISKAEEIFIRLFPNSEIGAFSLVSSVNQYAWTIISNGKKIRTKSGDSDNGIFYDIGEPLTEELEFLKMSFKNEDGVINYKWIENNGETNIYTEDQIGENYVFRIWSRFTGVELLDDDELLNDTQFRGYLIGGDDSEDKTNKEERRTFWKRIFRSK